MVDNFILIKFDFTFKNKYMKTPFQQAVESVKNGTLKAPSVSVGNAEVDYFSYQLEIHHFNLKLMARGMKFRGITFTQIKKYYGLNGKGAQGCLQQFTDIMHEYKQGLL